MKFSMSKNLLMCLAIAMVAVVFTGCGIPIKFASDINIAKDMQIPGVSDLEDNIDNLPVLFRNNLENLADYESVEDFLTIPFHFRRSEERCELPNIQSILDEAAESLPTFVGGRLEITSIIIKSVTIIASEGNFDSLDEFTILLTIGDAEYEYAITSADETNTVLVMASGAPVDLTALINDINFDGCFGSTLIMSGLLPENKIVFDAVLNLEIALRFRLI